MPLISRLSAALSFCQIVLGTDPQQCYVGAGAENRGPSSLVPCLSNGESACCLLGDTCLSGNTCYNFETGDLYQYGCTDITYTNSVCPYKCGWNSTLSPWTALEYCTDLGADVDNTWTCHAPESCGCAWNSTEELLILSPRGCKEMGTNARVALYAPSTLAPYVSLPSTLGGSTGYYSATVVSGNSTWVETAVPGYTPSSVTQLTTYQDQPTTPVVIEPGQNASASTAAAAASFIPSSSSTYLSSKPVGNSQTATTSGTMNNTTLSSPSSLSTGAKIGVGVGAAGGVCLLTAVAVACLVWRKRNRPVNQAQQTQHIQGPYHHQGLHMQGPQSFSPEQNDKPIWPIAYHHSSPPLPLSSPSYNHNEAPPYHDTRAMYMEVPPLELSGEGRVHEIGSEVSAMSSPRPDHVEVEAPMK